MLLAEVKKSLAALPPFKKVVAGVSGGADSVALAHILIRLGYDVTIAHLNHGLRGKESDADAEFARNLAKKWNVTFVTCKVTIPKKGNMENMARELRYAFLEKARKENGAGFIAVAHHMDDQIETILMHMERGAGLRGLCGMRLMSGKIIRPLLSVGKKDIIAYLKKEGQDFRTDMSNFDLNFRRNHLRRIVIPKLKRKGRNFEKNLLRLSAIAQNKIVTIEKAAAKWIREHVTNQTFERLDFLKLSYEIQSEVLFMLTGYKDIYKKNIREIKEFIKRAVTGKEKEVGGLTFYLQYGKITFGKNAAREAVLKKRKLGKREIKWGAFKIKYQGNSGLYVRQWKPGDRFIPAGMDGSKKLQDFFTDQKIPKWQRHKIPIFVDRDDQVLGVSDFRVAKDAGFLKQYLQINQIK